MRSFLDYELIAGRLTWERISFYKTQLLDFLYAVVPLPVVKMLLNNLKDQTKFYIWNKMQYQYYNEASGVLFDMYSDTVFAEDKQPTFGMIEYLVRAPLLSHATFGVENT